MVTNVEPELNARSWNTHSDSFSRARPAGLLAAVTALLAGAVSAHCAGPVLAWAVAASNIVLAITGRPIEQSVYLFQRILLAIAVTYFASVG